MTVHLTDGQVVGETEAQLVQLKGTTDVNVIIKNSGVNTMNYRFQEYNGGTWVDLGASGSDLYNTLTADQVRLFAVEATYPIIRIIGNASGGAFLEFVFTADVNRASAGAYTIMAA